MVIHGDIDPNFHEVARMLSKHVARGGGASVCVYHRGRKVVDIWAGSRDFNGSEWRSNTMAMSFSTSKGVLATLVHILADRGLIAYDEPVANYWPEFAAAGKERIRVRDVLTHRAGLPHFHTLIDHAERVFDWEHMTSTLARAQAREELRGKPAYHALTYGWLVGEIIQRATGRDLPSVIREELVEPLELEGLYIGAPKHAQKRAAALSPPANLPGLNSDGSVRPFAAMLSGLNRMTGLPIDPLLLHDALIAPGDPKIFWHPRILDVPVPAANGLFTARSLARVYAMIAGGGEIDGVRLLSNKAVRALSRVQTKQRDQVLVIPMHWRLGYHSAITLRGRLKTGFGHFGYGGSGAWACPKRQLAVAMTTNRLGGTPFGDLRIAEISSAALWGAKRASTAKGRSSVSVMQPSRDGRRRLTVVPGLTASARA
jgi:CubicO group peptidase (beta-lactamase class C family)